MNCFKNLNKSNIVISGIDEVQQSAKLGRQAVPGQDPVPSEAAAGEHRQGGPGRGPSSGGGRQQVVQAAALFSQAQLSRPLWTDQLHLSSGFKIKFHSFGILRLSLISLQLLISSLTHKNKSIMFLFLTFLTSYTT